MVRFVGFLVLFLFVPSITSSMTVGSNTAPSRQALANFTGANNIILGFAAMDNGFNFASSTTTCSFDCFIPVSGPVSLAQGRLFLFQDFICHNDFSLSTPGWIHGNNYRVEFPASVTERFLPTTQTASNMTFDRAVVSFNTNTTFRSPMRFRRTCTILGNGHKLTISKTNPLVVIDGDLTIQDAIVAGVGDTNLRCSLATGRITFRDCILLLERDYTFNQGGITFSGDTIITGTNRFIYSSSVATTLDRLSTLCFDQGTTFRYAPTNSRRDLLYFADKTSTLFLNGCSLTTTRTGMRLSRGTVLVDNKVTVSSEALNSGEAMLFANDITVNVLSGAVVDMYGQIKAF